MIGCLVPTNGDLIAVLVLVGVFAGLGKVAVDDYRATRAARLFGHDPPAPRRCLRLLRPGPYDWQSEDGRAGTKGTPPGATSR